MEGDRIGQVSQIAWCDVLVPGLNHAPPAQAKHDGQERRKQAAFVSLRGDLEVHDVRIPASNRIQSRPHLPKVPRPHDVQHPVLDVGSRHGGGGAGENRHLDVAAAAQGGCQLRRVVTDPTRHRRIGPRHQENSQTGAPQADDFPVDDESSLLSTNHPNV